jgi:mannose-6-phosphate isomerase
LPCMLPEYAALWATVPGLQADTSFSKRTEIIIFYFSEIYTQMIYQFQPILKQTLWGGDKIAPLKNIKDAPSNIGESWEISGVENNISVVSHGPEKGLTLTQLIEKHGSDLLGKQNYERFGTEFPLLIKIIDARQALSIQVHPNDETARLHGHSRGKTEMWYMLPSEPEASMYVGLKHDLTPEKFMAMVNDNTICDALVRYNVSAGDCFFLPAGRIHSIGAGCFLVEIQQTSDVTYRIYDFNRRDRNGNLRPLHVSLAADSIDYHARPDYKTHYTLPDNGRAQLVDCPYFTTSLWTIRQNCLVDCSNLDSFMILICTSGNGSIIENGQHEYPVTMGDTLLLPATTKEVELRGDMQVIETHVGQGAVIQNA